MCRRARSRHRCDRDGGEGSSRAPGTVSAGGEALGWRSAGRAWVPAWLAAAEESVSSRA